MKRKRNVFVMLTLLLMPIGFVGCSSDDETVQAPDTAILGKWEWVASNDEEPASQLLLTFAANKKVLVQQGTADGGVTCDYYFGGHAPDSIHHLGENAYKLHISEMGDYYCKISGRKMWIEWATLPTYGYISHLYERVE